MRKLITIWTKIKARKYDNPYLWVDRMDNAEGHKLWLTENKRICELFHKDGRAHARKIGIPAKYATKVYNKAFVLARPEIIRLAAHNESWDNHDDLQTIIWQLNDLAGIFLTKRQLYDATHGKYSKYGQEDECVCDD